MTGLILALLALLLAALAVEQRRARRDRAALSHVVHVNGTRGKSTVTRLIDAGLRAGGKQVFCKTTGTLPMVIGVDGVERPLARRGRANIREQLAILRRAAAEGAEVLVLECMAVRPELQWISQHRMVQADIGVITNVRLDHTDEMGETLEEICDALSGTIPQNGLLFTADAAFAGRLEQNAAPLGTSLVLTRPGDGLPDLDFPENLALALAVCERLGVGRETALTGMAGYRRDPYALSLHRLAGGALFVNGLSVNDPDSTERVWRGLRDRLGLENRRLVLLINNRPDRGYRAEHMLALAGRLNPAEVWLTGASRRVMARRLARTDNPPRVQSFSSAAALPLASPDGETVLFAAGNIASEGRALMERVEREATPYVQ